MKQKLYLVKADILWGDDSKQKRAAQLAKLEAMGLTEFEERQVVCTAEQALELILAEYADDYAGKRIQQQVKQVTEVDAGPDVAQLLGIMAEKISTAPQQSFNELCKQQQPGAALLDIAETMLLQDCCTDHLQENLAQGWRIIAVQPQPDQRRPDYILGRPRTLTSAMRG